LRFRAYGLGFEALTFYGVRVQDDLWDAQVPYLRFSPLMATKNILQALQVDPDIGASGGIRSSPRLSINFSKASTDSLKGHRVTTSCDCLVVFVFKPLASKLYGKLRPYC